MDLSLMGTFLVWVLVLLSAPDLGQAEGKGCPTDIGWTTLTDAKIQIGADSGEHFVSTVTSVSGRGRGPAELLAVSLDTGLIESHDCGRTWNRMPPPEGWPDWSGAKSVI